MIVYQTFSLFDETYTPYGVDEAAAPGAAVLSAGVMVVKR